MDDILNEKDLNLFESIKMLRYALYTEDNCVLGKNRHFNIARQKEPSLILTAKDKLPGIGIYRVDFTIRDLLDQLDEKLDNVQNAINYLSSDEYRRKIIKDYDKEGIVATVRLMRMRNDIMGNNEDN